jgi:DNA-binding SARP family transcriptional activator/tetratricopeptide (TPR) repeat protein
MVNMEMVRLLGEFRVEAGGMPLTLPRRHVRLLLALLALDVGRPVPIERLLRMVWPEKQPSDARAVLSTYLSRLRTALAEIEGVEVSRVGDAYLLDMDPELVDAYRFRRLARHAQATADLHLRTALAGEALALWTGPPLTGAGDETARATAAAGLEELRRQLVDLRVTAELQLGRHEVLVSELTTLVAADPLDERLVAHLVTALYRSGRRADALTVCRDARKRITDELGLDPGATLQQLEMAVLRSDPGLDLVSLPAANTDKTDQRAQAEDREPPEQLPAAGGFFVGRARDLNWLDETAGQPALIVITGPAGVGKTSTAVQWGRTRAGRFPDGQLYVDLRGFSSDSPLAPLTALTTLLLGLGLPYDQIPLDVDTAAGRYRTMTAGRRLLIILDNAAGTDQVRPLLSASALAVTIVTSRDALDGLAATDGAVAHRLGPLTAAESRSLLEHILGEGWLSVDPAAGAALADVCAHLPLALRIAGNQLRGTAPTALASYVAALRQDSLSTLHLSGDSRAVRSAFNHSYGRLAQSIQATFRMFGTVPLTAINPSTAATILAATPATAAAQLAALVAASMCDEKAPGIFTMHDLLREYATELSLAEGQAVRTAILDRLYADYLGKVDAAAKLLYAQMLRLPLTTDTDTSATYFADRNEAQAWLSRESVNFPALVRYAASTGRLTSAYQLADGLRGYFWLSQNTADWLPVATIALGAAEAAGDSQGSCAGHLSLGLANLCMSRYREAERSFMAGLAQAQQAPWPEGAAACLGSLGSVSLELGELDGAEANYRDAMLSNRRLGRESAEINNRANLALVQMLRGRFAIAAENLRRVIDYQHSAQLAAHEALNLHNLGRVSRYLGDLDEALNHLRAAVALSRQVGNVQSEASSLAQIAGVLCDQGRLDDALREAQVALDRMQDFDDPATEGEARQALGAIWHQRGEPDRARAHYERAIVIADEVERPEQKTAATIGLASAEADLGELQLARQHATQALAQARMYGYNHCEGCALTVVALVDLRLGAVSEAMVAAEQALAIHLDTGYRLGQARTRRILSDVAHQQGQTMLATEHRLAAASLLDDMGVIDRGRPPGVEESIATRTQPSR